MESQVTGHLRDDGEVSLFHKVVLGCVGLLSTVPRVNRNGCVLYHVWAELDITCTIESAKCCSGAETVVISNRWAGEDPGAQAWASGSPCPA